MNDVASIPLPKSWPRFANTALLHAVALARVVVLAVGAGGSKLEIEWLRARVAQLHEELRIKDARLSRVPARERPHYTPDERLGILALRAAVGWNAAETARRFLLANVTVVAWMGRLDEGGHGAPVRPSAPVNGFPDFA
jgi:hypothetical protein